MTLPEFTGSPSVTAWLQQQQQQQPFTSSLYNITGIDITDAPTSVAPLGSRTNISWIKIVLVILCILGLLFNGFVMVVLIYGKRSRQLSCNILIINQSLADFMGCLSIIINAVTATFISEYKKLPGASVICIIFEASCLISICSGASIGNLIVLTVERYFKILYITAKAFQKAPFC